MIYTQKIQKAIKFAAKTHNHYQQQLRKGKVIPYISHPLTVGIILALANAPEDVIVAGILHDTIEDSIQEKKVSVEMLTERFGAEVALLVLSVTEQDRELPWEQRKQEALDQVAHFSHESLLVKSADTLSNGRELLDDHKRSLQDGTDIFARFSAPKEKVLEHQIRIITAILEVWPENVLAFDLKDLLVGIEMVEKAEKKQ